MQEQEKIKDLEVIEVVVIIVVALLEVLILANLIEILLIILKKWMICLLIKGNMWIPPFMVYHECIQLLQLILQFYLILN